MRMFRDVDKGQWIVDRAGEWATVAGIAGTGFEAYARILHPVTVTRSPTEETTWSWGQVARSLGRQLRPWTDWMELTDNEELIFAPVDDGWRIGQSDLGWFDPRLMAWLTTHLREATTTPEQLVLAFWEGFGQFSGNVVYVTSDPSGDDGGAGKRDALARLSPEFREVYDSGLRLRWPARDFLLAESSLAELADPDWVYSAGIGWEDEWSPGPTPQMIWPADHSWVLATEIDWDSTVVAGARALIDAVLADPAFEAFETDPDRHPTEPR